MNIGFIIICALKIISLFIVANQHGNIKTGKYNFWVQIVATIIGMLLILWAMGWQV